MSKLVQRFRAWRWWRRRRADIEWKMQLCSARATGYWLAQGFKMKDSEKTQRDLDRENRNYRRFRRLYYGHSPWHSFPS